MEASDTAGQPPQEPGQTDATGQEQPATSQEQPNQDSNLTTPQPDQPVPSEGERQDAAPDPAQDSPPVQDQSTTSGAYKPEAERQGELDREREEHNARTAGEQPQDDPLTSASDAPQDEA
jgi:hypothetical protein